ncbi:transposase [Streptomyces sp. NBS 14/10]|nr:transposase [Streptomyces sp. NBS 14/10]KAK1186487.1 transposase [Streptomyces sp. NBS 14/10]
MPPGPRAGEALGANDKESRRSVIRLPTCVDDLSAPAESATAPHDGGAIVIDDSGGRKDGTATAHVGWQWLGRLGKTDNGIVTVTTVWTDGRVYYPLHATPYTPAHHFARGRSDPAFRTKPQLAAHLAARGKEASFSCRAVVADCAYLSQRRLVPRTARGRPGLRGHPQAARRHLGSPTSRTPPSKPPTP